MSGLFGGGNNSAAQAVAAAPVPTPAPPVTADNPSVIAAEADQAQANLIKKSVKHTILAGDTPYGGPGVAGQAAIPTSYKSKLG